MRTSHTVLALLGLTALESMTTQANVQLFDELSAYENADADMFDLINFSENEPDVNKQVLIGQMARVIDMVAKVNRTIIHNSKELTCCDDRDYQVKQSVKTIDRESDARVAQIKKTYRIIGSEISDDQKVDQMFDQMQTIVAGSIEELETMQGKFGSFQQFYSNEKIFNDTLQSITDYLLIARDIQASCLNPAHQAQSKYMTVTKFKFAALGELKEGNEHWFNTMYASLKESKMQNICAEKETGFWIQRSSRTIADCVARPYPY